MPLLTIAVALVCGAAAFLIGRFTGLNTNVTTLMMVAFALPALLIGFFKKQGLGFIIYMIARAAIRGL